MIWKRIEQWYQKLGTVHEWHCLIGHMMSGYGLIFVGQDLQKRSILIHFGWTNHNFVLHQLCEEYDGDNIT